MVGCGYIFYMFLVLVRVCACVCLSTSVWLDLWKECTLVRVHSILFVSTLNFFPRFSSSKFLQADLTHLVKPAVGRVEASVEM